MRTFTKLKLQCCTEEATVIFHAQKILALVFLSLAAGCGTVSDSPYILP